MHVNDVKQCAKCGACVPVCPIYQATGRESAAARGKLHLLEKMPPETASAAYAEILSQCLQCGACSAVCPRGIDPASRIAEGRARLTRSAGKNIFLRALSRKILDSPLLLKGTAAGLPLLHLLPPESGLRLRLGLLDPAEKNSLHAAAKNKPRLQQQEKKSAAGINCFAGCFARYLEPRIMAANERLLGSINITALSPAGQACCGLAAHAAGGTATAKKLARQNIAAFSNNTLPILTTCASCYKHLAAYPELFDDEPDQQEQARLFAGRLVEFASFFANQPLLGPIFEAQPQIKPAKKILYHDPCHLRFGPEITRPPRQLLALLPGVARVELPRGPQCCGHGGLFHLGQPRLSENILAALLVDFEGTEADLVVSTCTGCLLQWRQGLHNQGKSAQVKHLAVLLTEALGGS